MGNESKQVYSESSCKHRETIGSEDCPRLNKEESTPLTYSYNVDLDNTRDLGTSEANNYQLQTGILHWMVELGRVDIMTKVSVLSSHLLMPREGHLDVILHLFA